MSPVLMETLVWTGALIALVLVLRRPVARMMGPQTAYALWALPLIRLVLPPLTLPQWLAPLAPEPQALPAPVPSPVAVADPLPLAFASEPLVLATAPAAAPVAAPASAPAGFDLVAMLADLPLAQMALALWLGGAGVFLWRRFAAYFVLRDALLAEGREVGRVAGRTGAIRLVETPGTAAPIAFGVLDPVIALPPGFMALPDRRARDLALAHELAHHRGGDLVINVLVQPLFALHWFNPLGHYGWLALRRDQEAACDARVVAASSPEERAAYARLIAGFATGPALAPNAALTAPMACPVLGEKSIIHRLRSLSMSQSTLRRRLAGRALLGFGVLALPLTSSVSYAAGETMAQPEPPAPPAAPEAPEAPTPPEAPVEVLIVKVDPDAPDAPDAPDGPDGKDARVIEQVFKDADGKERRVRVVVRGGPGAAGEEPRIIMRRLGPDGAAGHDGEHKAEHREMVIELRESLADAEHELADLPRIIREAGRARAEARAGARAQVMLRRGCKPSSTEPAEATTDKDGTTRLILCERRVYAAARNGLQEARDEIAANKDIPEDTRQTILRELDAAIARNAGKEG